jgi:predicted dehydrogenase
MLYFFGNSWFISGTSMNQAHLYPADDMVAGTIRFESGVVLNGAWCFSAPQDAARDRCFIVGSEGTMEFSIFTMQRLSISKNGRVDELVFDAVPHVQQPMIEKVTAHFLGEGPNPCSGAEGVMVMEMIDKFTISA